MFLVTLHIKTMSITTVNLTSSAFKTVIIWNKHIKDTIKSKLTNLFLYIAGAINYKWFILHIIFNLSVHMGEAAPEELYVQVTVDCWLHNGCFLLVCSSSKRQSKTEYKSYRQKFNLRMTTLLLWSYCLHSLHMWVTAGT